MVYLHYHFFNVLQMENYYLPFEVNLILVRFNSTHRRTYKVQP